MSLSASSKARWSKDDLVWVTEILGDETSTFRGIVRRYASLVDLKDEAQKGNKISTDHVYVHYPQQPGIPKGDTYFAWIHETDSVSAT